MRMLVAILLLACSACASFASEARSATASTDVNGIRVAAERFLVAFDNLEWEAFRAAWASSPSVFFPFEDIPERASGRAEVEHRFKELFDEARANMAGPPYLKLQPQELEIQRFGDAGLVTFMMRKDDRISRRTLVFAREGGEWKLAHLHASDMERQVPD